ncbi:MAG: hydroxyacylglutathione hydrolase [Magnetococcales bacterium]|nr:hydroxyacylglutathione hydrolase [Magnetococcales bacterium]
MTTQPALSVTPVLARQDNYVWLFPTGSNQVAAVDPGEALPVLNYLNENRLSLSHILLTHHHYDHQDGVPALLEQFPDVELIGFTGDQYRLPKLTHAVNDGDSLNLGSQNIQVWHTPGHTTGHVVYRIGDCLFSGDILFSYGSGRLFEGDPPQMWRTLKRLRTLPDTLFLCCGHEYTVTNLRFATDLEPHNQSLSKLFDWACDRTDLGKPTVPNLFGLEKRFNPFFRCDDSEFLQAIGLSGKSPEEVLATIRERRNGY